MKKLLYYSPYVPLLGLVFIWTGIVKDWVGKNILCLDEENHFAGSFFVQILSVVFCSLVIYATLIK